MDANIRNSKHFRIWGGDFETSTKLKRFNRIGGFVYSWAVGVKMTPNEIKKRRYPVPIREFKEMRLKMRVKAKDEILYFYGIDIDSFIEFIKKLDRVVTSKLVLYFHNGSGFDFHFIMDHLLDINSHGLNLVQDYEITHDSVPDDFNERKKSFKWDYERYLKDFKGKTEPQTFDRWFKNAWNHLKFNEWKMAVKDNKIYSIEIGENIKLYDSKLLFADSIRGYGETLAKDHPQDPPEFWHKGSINENNDYNKTSFYNSIEELEEDGNELNYLLQDVKILVRYMDDTINGILCNPEVVGPKIVEYFQQRKTSSSMAFEMLIGFIFEHYLEKYLKEGKIIAKDFFIDKKKVKRYKWSNSKQWKSKWAIKKVLIGELFPADAIDDETYRMINVNLLDNYIKGYQGGNNQLNPAKQGIPLKVVVFDENASYSSVMGSDENLYPIGKPLLSAPPEGKYVTLYKLEVLKKFDRIKGMPILSSVNSFDSKNYVNRAVKGMVYYLCDVELRMVLKTYKLTSRSCRITPVRYFRAVSGKELFGDYVDTFQKLRLEASLSGYITRPKVYKKFQVGPYGKMAQHWYDTNAKYWDEWGDEYTYTRVGKRFYIPVATWITAYARCKLYNAAYEIWDDYGVYCDTDSFHIDWGKWHDQEGRSLEKLEQVTEMQIDDYKLGYWKNEKTPEMGTRALYYGPKKYIHLYRDQDNKLVKETKAAGFMLDDVDLKFTDLLLGCMVPNQLQPKKRGNIDQETGGVYDYGIVLTPTLKEIKPIWEAPTKINQIHWLGTPDILDDVLPTLEEWDQEFEKENYEEKKECCIKTAEH